MTENHSKVKKVGFRYWNMLGRRPIDGIRDGNMSGSFLRTSPVNSDGDILWYSVGTRLENCGGFGDGLVDVFRLVKYKVYVVGYLDGVELGLLYWLVDSIHVGILLEG